MRNHSENNEEVKGNRLKNSIHRPLRSDAKTAKGVFVGFVQILEERPQLNTLRCHGHEFHGAGSGSEQNQALTGD